jgi:hypothetical protein
MAKSSRSSVASGVQDYLPDELEGIAEGNESTEAPPDVWITIVVILGPALLRGRRLRAV